MKILQLTKLFEIEQNDHFVNPALTREDLERKYQASEHISDEATYAYADYIESIRSIAGQDSILISDKSLESIHRANGYLPLEPGSHIFYRDVPEMNPFVARLRKLSNRCSMLDNKARKYKLKLKRMGKSVP